MEEAGDDSFKNANEIILLKCLPPASLGLTLLPVSRAGCARGAGAASPARGPFLGPVPFLPGQNVPDRQKDGGGTGSMLSLATCCLFHSKPPFLPTLQPRLPSPHSSPSPVDRAGIRSHLPNAFLMLSLILHRQHLRQQNQIFSSALSCFLQKGSGMPFPSWVRGEGVCHGWAGGSPGEA